MSAASLADLKMFQRTLIGLLANGILENKSVLNGCTAQIAFLRNARNAVKGIAGGFVAKYDNGIVAGPPFTRSFVAASFEGNMYKPCMMHTELSRTHIIPLMYLGRL